MRELPISELISFTSSNVGHHLLRLKVGQLADGSTLGLPCALLIGGQEGPRFCILAAQHGNEWNGVYLIHRLSQAIAIEEVLGTLILLPIANPLAFGERRRVSSLDGIDLAWAYGSSTPRKPTEHLGRTLFESIFSQVNCLIDLHSGGPGEYIPHILTARPEDVGLLAYLNIPYIQVRDPGYRGLIALCSERGITAFLIEVGRGHSLDLRYLPRLLDGLVNFMRAIGLLSGPAEEGVEPYIFTKKYILPAPAAGFFQGAVELGSRVKRGTCLGHITPLFAADIPILSPQAGIVLYLRREPVVNEGDSLVHLA